MIWLIPIGLALFGLYAICAIASQADARIATMRLERAQRLYRVAAGTATDEDREATLCYEMDGITYAPDFATFCERNAPRL